MEKWESIARRAKALDSTPERDDAGKLVPVPTLSAEGLAILLGQVTCDIECLKAIVGTGDSAPLAFGGFVNASGRFLRANGDPQNSSVTAEGPGTRQTVPSGRSAIVGIGVQSTSGASTLVIYKNGVSIQTVSTAGGVDQSEYVDLTAENLTVAASDGLSVQVGAVSGQTSATLWVE